MVSDDANDLIDLVAGKLLDGKILATSSINQTSQWQAVLKELEGKIDHHIYDDDYDPHDDRGEPINIETFASKMIAIVEQPEIRGLLYV